MPTINRRLTVAAAGGVIDNALANSQYEFAPFDCTIEIGMIVARSLVTCAVFSGPDVLAEPGTTCQIFTTERNPVYPDDYSLEDEAAQGDRLKVSYANANAAGGPDVTITSLRITPA
jgi:hypothetical protein